MPDLDELMDTLLGEVKAHTHAPGAPLALRQAKRRRVRSAAAAAVLVVLVAGGLTTLTVGGGDGLSLINEPAAPSPEQPVVQETDQPAALSDESFRRRVGETLTGVPGWTSNDHDPTLVNPCGGGWSSGASGGSGGTFDLSSSSPGRSVWSDQVGFPTPAQAAAAVVALSENLASCTTLSWRVQPVGQTGAVLASSPLGVVWIHQQGSAVATLQVPTADGPPAVTVQVTIADLMGASMR